MTNSGITDGYTALTPIEAIRVRPGMYVGDTDTPTQLLTEIIDNSFDEISNGFSNLFQLNIDVDNQAYWVQDNGRGIKVYNMADANGNIRDSVELLCTETHSGSKFDNNDYGILIGMHGVGMVVVNALSNWMVIKTRDREKPTIIHEYQFINSILESKTSYEDQSINNWSTCIGFSPNSKYFDSMDVKLEDIIKRVMLAQARFNSSDFYYNGKMLTKRTFYDYVKMILNCKNEFKLLQFEEAPNKNIKVYLNYVDGNTSNIMGDVNLRHCEGTYITSFQTLLKKCICEKLGKITNKINPQLLLYGLNCYISLTVPEPTFDSQAKTRMKLRVNELINPLQDQINWFLDQDNVLNIIQTNLEKVLKKKLSIPKSASTSVSAQNKLRDCVNTPGDVLYIVEGESALGPLKQIRNVHTEAIYPLKGKVLNVEKASIDVISKNIEIKDLIEACGPKGNRRYKKIKILADADYDGGHIAVLTILVINMFFVDYIKSGNLSVILPPLFGVKLKDSYKMIYDQAELDQYRQFPITRFKGLGEMNPEQLEVVIRSNVEYVITYPNTDEQLRNTIDVIVNTDLKKKIMTIPEFTFNTVLSKVLNIKS